MPVRRPIGWWNESEYQRAACITTSVTSGGSTSRSSTADPEADPEALADSYEVEPRDYPGLGHGAFEETKAFNERILGFLTREPATDTVR